jgi:hypothetical protein
VLVGWVVPQDERLASFRYRCMIPMAELERQGVSTRFGQGDITVFSKHWMPITELEMCMTKVVFDMCDDHFGGRFDSYYRRAIELADAVVCSTQRLAERVEEETGVVPHVVTDPYEFPKATPQMPSRKVKNLFWFGHPTNLPALQNELRRLKDYNLAAVTEAPGAMPWSYQNMMRGFSQCDAVILPIEDKPKKMAKSPNRMVESIRQGRFVVANKMPAYEPYGMWQGDILQGLEFASLDPEGALDMVHAAQEIVEQLHAPAVVARQWKDVFECL